MAVTWLSGPKPYADVLANASGALNALLMLLQSVFTGKLSKTGFA
jgi:hypothetical protein